MQRRRRLTARIGTSITPFLIAATAFAQTGQPAGKQPATSNQLPLSGRTGQNGSVTATESPVPGTTTSVNTINPSVQVQGPYAGSAQSRPPFSGKLSLREAVERALRCNLGSIGVSQAVDQRRCQARVARSALSPKVNGNVWENIEQRNLAAQGLLFKVPSLSGAPGIPSVVGPFSYFHLRATLSQTVVDL